MIDLHLKTDAPYNFKAELGAFALTFFKHPYQRTAINSDSNAFLDLPELTIDDLGHSSARVLLDICDFFTSEGSAVDASTLLELQHRVKDRHTGAVSCEKSLFYFILEDGFRCWAEWHVLLPLTRIPIVFRIYKNNSVGKWSMYAMNEEGFQLSLGVIPKPHSELAVETE